MRAIASERHDNESDLVRRSAPASLNGKEDQPNLAESSEATLHLCSEFAATAVAPIPRWKRVLDVSFVLLALPLWLPITMLLMVWTKMVSRGPVFYRQERVGYLGKRFMIFKFRTMYLNAETRTHEEYFAQLMRGELPMIKLDLSGDSRLIACGRFLRATGLDELPQVFNILRGEMSLVGPRPCLPNEFQRYDSGAQARVHALPGLTGYWQVNGKNNTTFKEMIAMDIFYTRNMSVGLDLKIMSQTIPALIGQVVETRRRSRKRAKQPGHRDAPARQRLNSAMKHK